MYDLRRVSACCRREIFHPYPMDTRSLDDALQVNCAGCGQPTHVVVMDEREDLIWDEDWDDAEDN